MPAWLLHRHAIEADLGVDRKHDPEYEYAIFRNRDGRMRLVWWSSAGISRVPARRVDAFSYTGKLWFNPFLAAPPPTWLRGYSSRKVQCLHSGCHLSARMLDRTRWVAI